ncbi:hypothetical protein AB0395_22100 [Streptosporangium sp. NPDC051023]|uniref:hypothetical protein n=1 Tax=Streptosporangium sp. NPDC051023 TaxID=3155410 RepID=UPI00344C4155
MTDTIYDELLRDANTPGSQPPNPGEAEPVLQVIEDAYRAARVDPREGEQTERALDGIPFLLQRLRAVERELARWQCLPNTVEYVITDGEEPTGQEERVSVQEAGAVSDAPTLGTPYIQTTYVRSWSAYVPPLF